MLSVLLYEKLTVLLYENLPVQSYLLQRSYNNGIRTAFFWLRLFLSPRDWRLYSLLLKAAHSLEWALIAVAM